MKKLFLLLSAMALVIGLSQCTRPAVQEIAGGNGETQYVKLTTSFDDGSKLNVNEATGQLNLSWELNDEINVVEGGSGTLKCTAVSNGGKTGTFEGTVSHTSGNLKFRFGNEQNYNNQHHTAITSSEICLEGTSEYKSDGDYRVTMTLPYAILKLDLHNLVSSTSNVTISVEGEGTKAIVTNVTTATTNLYVLIPVTGGPVEKEYTLSGSAGSATKTWNLSSNTIYTEDNGSGTGTGTGAAIVIEPEWVNFDLPEPFQNLKWAKGNLGATNGVTAESWYGDYYAWGELIPYYTSLTWTAYNACTVNGWTTEILGGGGTANSTYGYAWQSYCNGADSFVEWDTPPHNGTTLNADRDVASTTSSGVWRIPESTEFLALFSGTLWVWTEHYNNISSLCGYVVYKVKTDAHKCQTKNSDDTGNGEYTDYEFGYSYALTDTHIFIPAAGFFDGTNLRNAAYIGYYWESSLSSWNNDFARYMIFYIGEVDAWRDDFRHAGYSVRPVR